MTTYFSWLPTMNFGTYVGYSGDNQPNYPNTPENFSSIPNERNGMFGFWSDIFGKAPKFEKYSNENLKRLSDLLEKKTKFANDESMVEILKEMTQILIWGDQHKQPILDYFFEKNMHYVILNTLKQSKSPYVTKQILQSMNILYENIHDIASLYYLLSNNYVNDIICHKYDFSNDEILAYYIYFLRTLSFKLDQNTLSCFFNERHDDFPLYSEAIKFFNSDESMIRAAVRTVTLNIFAINDREMQEFVLDRNVSPYFSNLVNFIAEFSTTLDEICSLPDYEKHYQRFNYYLAEHCDNFYYINDIIGLKNERMNQELTSHLMDLLLKPIYADSLVQRISLPYKQSVRVDSVVALTLLCHVLHIFRHPHLVTAVVAMLFSNSPELMDYPHSPRLNSSYANPSTLFKKGNLYREAIMGFLMPESPENSDDHDYLDLNTLPALCLIYMSCRNRAISPDVLLASEVYPRKLLKTRRLKDTLSSYSEDLSNEPPFSFSQGRLLDSPMVMTGASTLQNKPSNLYNESLLSSIYRAEHGLFTDFMNEIPYGSSPSIPSIKIMGESRPQAKSYRAVLIQKILTLLCYHYRSCRPITLQMATELLLELLYYNGSGECLTQEQTEMMDDTEKGLKERVKNYFLKGHEFQLEELEKAVNESMFGGDKYVREIIMNAKLLFPPPPSIPQPAISADPSKKKEVQSTISNEIIRDIKTLHLLRQSRLLLSKESISEESSATSAEEEEYMEEDDDCKEELAYHNELVDEKFVQAHQQMYSTSTNNKNSNNKVHKRSDTKDSLAKMSEYDKRKKAILDELGIEL